MQVSKKALNELRELLVSARELVGFAIEAERTSVEEVTLSPAMANVSIDLGHLGLEALIVMTDAREEWQDHFTGLLFSLDLSVEVALDKTQSEKQKELLEELKGVVISIDQWHTKYIAD